MKKGVVNDGGVQGLQPWHKNSQPVIHSALKAIRSMLPGEQSMGVEFGFERILSEPLCLPRVIWDGSSERLPFPDAHLDFILLCNCTSPLNDVTGIFTEAFRVLKKNGVLIVAFLDRNTPAGDVCAIPSDNEGVPNTEKVLFQLSHSGFNHFELVQTLFSDPERISEVQEPRHGYGEGSFVVVRADKCKKRE